MLLDQEIDARQLHVQIFLYNNHELSRSCLQYLMFYFTDAKIGTSSEKAMHIIA